MPRWRTIWRALPATLFGIFLAAPLALGLAGFRAETIGENRKLAEAPETATLTDSNESFRAFFQQLALWHSDNFPTRSLWIRLRTQWLFSLFGASDQVYVGEDGWMYYRTVLDQQLPVIEMRTAADIEKSVAGFRRLSQLLSQRGISLYVLPVPLKQHFYPENLPPQAARVRRYTRFEEFMDSLAAEPGVQMIDVRPILTQAKASGLPIFYRTDFHWTDPAAALVGKRLLDAMARSAGASYAVDQWQWDVAPWPDMSGGQARFLPLFVPPDETTVQIENVRPVRSLEKLPDDRVENHYRTSDPSGAALMPPLYIFGDSFFDGIIRAGFLANFAESANARLYVQDVVTSFEGRPDATRFAVIEFISVAWPSVDGEVERLTAHLEALPEPVQHPDRHGADGVGTAGEVSTLVP